MKGTGGPPVRVLKYCSSSTAVQLFWGKVNFFKVTIDKMQFYLDTRGVRAIAEISGLG